MNLQVLIKKILEEYQDECRKNLKGNELACSIRNDLKNCIDKSMLSSTIKLRGSAGQGKWALIPWLGFFDREIINTAECGFYIVYLFSANMKRVYLSLNQGYTFYNKKYGRKDALEKISLVSNYFCENLNLVDSKMIRNIDLLDQTVASNKYLAEGYEKGNILAYEYEKDALPTNAQLLYDLSRMLKLYAELKTKLFSVNNMDLTVDYISRNSNYSSMATKTDDNFKKLETDDFVKYVTNNLCKVRLIKDSNRVSIKTTKKISKDIDYLAKEKQNSKLGFLGEEIIFECAKQWVKKRFGTSNGVIHVSKEQGDGAGYDIQSKVENGQTLYIEVKTTSGSIAQPFYLSRNELVASKKYGNQFILLRLYNVNKKHNLQFSYYCISGPLDKCSRILLEPINYQGTLLKKLNTGN